MSSWLDKIKKPRLFFDVNSSDPRMEKNRKFVDKVIIKIVGSELLDFIRKPNIIQHNFNFLIPIERLSEMNVQTPSMVLLDWEGKMVYMEYLDTSSGYSSIARHHHFTPYGNLYTYEIRGWREGTDDSILIERWPGSFYETTLPNYLLKNWGIKENTLVYELLKERIKNEIISLIEYNVHNGVTQYNYGRSEVRQMWERSNGGLEQRTHSNGEY